MKAITLMICLVPLSVILFLSCWVDWVVVQTSCPAYNVRIKGSTVPAYRAHGVILFGKGYTLFRVTTDDAPDIIFATREGGPVQRHHLDYVSAGAHDFYAIPCVRPV